MCHIFIFGTSFPKMQASITRPTKPMNELWSLLLLSQVGHFSNKNSCRLEGMEKQTNFSGARGFLRLGKGEM